MDEQDQSWNMNDAAAAQGYEYAAIFYFHTPQMPFHCIACRRDVDLVLISCNRLMPPSQLKN